MTGGNDERWQDGVDKRLEKLEKKVEGLEAWMQWVLGAATGVGVVVGAFAKTIGGAVGKLLGMP